MTNYTTDNTEEYRRLQLVAETQPTYGAVQGWEGGGDDAGPWMRRLGLGSGRDGGRIVSGEAVAGEPVPERTVARD